MVDKIISKNIRTVCMKCGIIIKELVVDENDSNFALSHGYCLECFNNLMKEFNEKGEISDELLGKKKKGE